MTECLKTLIVDDEELARQLLRSWLATMPEIEIRGECSNGFEALKAIQELQPDLVLLDVQMPKLDGFEVLELVEATPPPAIVFTTAHDEYALRAFEVAAIDYLLKPFSAERLRQAVERVLTRRAPAAPAPANAHLNAAAHGPAHPLHRLVVRDGAQIALIPVEKLLCVEAQEDYVALHTTERSYIKKQTLGSLEAALDPLQFVRVHRGWIVNLQAAVRLQPYTKDSSWLLLGNGRKIPVSRAGLARLRQAWGE